MPNDNTNLEMYPPLPPEELRDAHAFENLERVVVTQNGVYGRSKGGGWVRLQPLAEVNQTRS